MHIVYQILRNWFNNYCVTSPNNYGVNVFLTYLPNYGFNIRSYLSYVMKGIKKITKPFYNCKFRFFKNILFLIPCRLGIYTFIRQHSICFIIWDLMNKPGIQTRMLLAVLLVLSQRNPTKRNIQATFKSKRISMP